MVERHAAVLQHDLRRVRGVLAGLLLDARNDPARGRGRHDEGADSSLASGLVGHGEDDRDVGGLARGDELLDAVQQVGAVLRLGARGDRRGIRPGVRLGEGERAEHLAARDRLQPALLLSVIAEAVQDAGDEVVDRDDRARRAVARRHLLAGDRERGRIHAGAAPLFGDRDAEQPHAGERLELLAREGAFAVPLRGARRELGAREGAHRFAQHLVVALHQHRAASRAPAPPRSPRRRRCTGSRPRAGRRACAARR